MTGQPGTGQPRAGEPGAEGPPGLVVDARGRRCPIPVIELARAMPSVAPGTRVEVLADDPAAASDIPAWCQMRGQDYLGARPLPDGPGAAYLVRRVR